MLFGLDASLKYKKAKKKIISKRDPVMGAMVEEQPLRNSYFNMDALQEAQVFEKKIFSSC